MYIVKRKIRAGGASYPKGAKIENVVAEGLLGFGDMVKTGAIEKVETPKKEK